MLRAIAGALVKSVRRDLAGYASLKTNNFFLFVVLLVWGALNSGVEPVSSYPFLLLLAILMLLPASGDPMEKIPGVRLALWPLSRSTRVALLVGSVVLSPAVWVMVALLAWRASAAIALGFLALIAVARVWGRRLHFVIRLPGHGLVANNLRQMLTILDTYLALTIAAGGTLWRILADHPDPASYPILSLGVAMALSTYAQCLFALDGPAGMTRYQLLPVPGWRIVLAKDAAYLGLTLVMLLPLAVPPGLAFALTALAFGRYPTMRVGLQQQRWRFTSGRVLWGVLQGLAGAALGFATIEHGLPPLVGAAVLYALSLWWAGRAWNKASR